ncbi:hypothetical protein Tco_1227811 [Tanacetum coccineum]
MDNSNCKLPTTAIKCITTIMAAGSRDRPPSLQQDDMHMAITILTITLIQDQMVRRTEVPVLKGLTLTIVSTPAVPATEDFCSSGYKNINELRAERMAKNANPLALVATAQTLQDPYYQSSKPHKLYAPTSKASLPTDSCNYKITKGKEIANQFTHHSESASEEDCVPEQALKDKNAENKLSLRSTSRTLQTYQQQPQNFLKHQKQECGTTPKEFGHYAKECRKPKRVKDSTYHKEKMLLCKQAEKGVQLQAEQSDWLVDTDEEIDEQELEAHYKYVAKDLGGLLLTSWHEHEPLEQYVLETDDSNVTPDSPDMCDNDIQDDQNDVECDDERVALANLIANLIANLKLDVDENKKIQKQLKKANATLTQNEITELQCLYLHKVRECDCLAQKLSEQTEFVSKEIYTELSQSFAKLEKHSISLEIALQECQEQLKNDTVCKEKASNVFRKEREQYFEIQDLKAQLQDKNIAVSELRNL